MKIILDIAPHEDGVHCGDCQFDFVSVYKESGESFSKCIGFLDENLDGIWTKDDEGGPVRNEKCISAEREYRGMTEAMAELRSACELQDRVAEVGLSALMRLEKDFDAVAVERDAMKKALNGLCVYCAKAKPLPIPGSNLVGCEYLKERGITGMAGKRKDCPHWEFDAEKVGK